MKTFAELLIQEKQGEQRTTEQVVEKLATWFRSLAWFMERMWNKILKNQHKTGWHGCSLAYLRFRLGQELEELDEIFQDDDDSEWVDHVVDECADIANFAMMLADNARRIAENSKRT